MSESATRISPGGEKAARRQPWSASRISSPRLVGRGQELGALLHAALSPRGLALVEGEAGVGKSRLVQELLGHPELEQCVRLVGHCHRLAEPFPLGPVAEALAGAAPLLEGLELPTGVGVLRGLLPELPLPREANDAGAAAGPDRHLLFRAVRDLFRVLPPTVVVLEDLHWADAATHDLLAYLAEDFPAPLVVVGTYRREDLPSASPLLGLASRIRGTTGCHLLALAPLPPAEVADLIAAILDVETVSEEFAAYLHERTSGIPFAVEEVLRLLEDHGLLVQRDGRWIRRSLAELEVPPAIRDAVVERVSVLSAPARQLVEAAAVLEVPAPETLLAATAGLDEEQAVEHLREVVESALLTDGPSGKLAFRHPLAAEAVYGAIPPPTRQRLHLRAGHALETTEPQPLIRLARHFKEAGDQQQWVGYAEAAAETAMTLADNASAFDLLKEAVAGVAEPSPQLLWKLAQAASRGLSHDEAIPVLEDVLSRGSLSPSQTGELELSLGWLRFQAGNVEQAFEHVRRAVPLLGHNPALQARALATLGMPWVREGTAGEHLRALRRAGETADRAGDPEAKAAVLGDRAYALVYLGRRGWREAVGDLPSGATDIEVRQRIRALVNVAEAAAWVGHLDAARELLAECRDLVAASGYERVAGGLEAIGLLLDLRAGEWDGLGERAQRLARELGDVPQARLVGQLVNGSLTLARGQREEALEHLGAARSLGDTCGIFPAAIAATAATARLHLSEGDPAHALEELTDALELVEGKQIWAWATEAIPQAVTAFVGVGRHSEADDVVARFAEEITGCDLPAAQVALSECRGLLSEAHGDHAAAVTAFRQAASRWGALHRPYEAAQSLERVARVLVANGADEAAGAGRSALEAFRDLGATWDEARVNRLLREGGVGVPATWRGGSRGYGDDLSPRQREIALLVAQGRTTREIAAMLFISPRTVEDHVAKAMRKLGVPSRSALAAEVVAAAEDASPARNP